MEGKKEIKGVLKYTNDEGMQIFGEGDNVICRTEDGKRYIGRIAAIGGTYLEKEHQESAVFIATSKNKICSNVIIKVADIANICRLPVKDETGYPEINEVLDRDKFLEMIVGLGHEKEKAEMLYKHVETLISLYNIPLSSMLADAIRETELSVEGKNMEELLDIRKNLLGLIAGFFQSITNMIKEVWIPGIESQVVM